MSNHHHHRHSEHRQDDVLNNGAADAEVLDPEVSETEVLDPEILPDEEAASSNDPQETAADADAQETAGNGDAQENADNGDAQENADAADDQETAGNADEQDAQDGEDKQEAKKPETDWRDAYVRLAADFDNYRKRTAKEQDDVRKRERERVIGIWLDVYDNAERALASLPEKEGPWYEGFVSLVHQMDKCLATLSIKACDDMGKKFDPKRHEAIATCPNPAMENNTIMHIERRGFEYENGDIARVARVIVVRNPS